MKAIVAVDKNWGIGRDNDLLFSIPTDMKFFRTTTLNKIVVMGGNTLRSFPNGNPLKNRVNVVLSTKIERDDCVCVKQVSQLLERLKEYKREDIFVIGGASVYKTLLDYCEEVFVTKVEADGNADAFFPNLDLLRNWEMVEEGEEIEDNGYKIKFTKYQNREAKKY